MRRCPLDFCLMALVFVALMPHGPVGAQGFLRRQADAQFRGAAFDPLHGLLFLAAYDKQEVWAMDPASGDRLWAATSGRGPGALAVHPTGVLAVANRLDGTVTMFDAATGAPLATVRVGEGPTGIGTTDEGFLVTCAFSDAVYLVVPGSEDDPRVVENLPVPGRIVSSRNRVVIASTAGNMVHVYAAPLSAGSKVREIPLDGSPLGMVGLSGGRLAVLTPEKIDIYDAEDGTKIAERSVEGTDLAGDGDALYLLSGDEMVELDAKLETKSAHPLENTAQLLHVMGGLCVALDPMNGAWERWNPRGYAVAETGPAPTQLPAGVASVAPAATFSMAEAPDVDAAARVTPPEATPEAASPPAGVSAESPSTPVPPPMEEVGEPAPEAEAMEPVAAPTRTYKRYPASFGGGGAPHPGEPPSSPLGQIDRQSIADALRQPQIFTEEGVGFQMIDWSKMLESAPIKADRSLSREADGSYSAEGSVTFTLGNVQFYCDSLIFRPEPIQVHAVGSVRIVQENSTLTADEVYYEATPKAPDEGQPASPPMFRGTDAEGQAATAGGRIRVSNVHIVEPGRELTAEHIEYDFDAEAGEIRKVSGWANLFYFHAERLVLRGRRSFDGEDVWITTCDREPPHYRIRLSEVSVEDGQVAGGSWARLQFGETDTPFFLPKWRSGGAGAHPWTLDFDSGRQADIGYYVNLGQRLEMSPDVGLGPRLFVTEKQGVGFGADLDYDLRERPDSRLFRTTGEAHGLYTTDDDAYLAWYHRYEYSPDLALRMQVEHWDDRDFYKDFYYEIYRHRTAPRTFANVTYRRPAYIASGTVSGTTHSWVSGTERTPEATFHLLDRPLFDKLRLSFDTITGYNNAEPYGASAARSVNIARLSYDWDPVEAFNVMPYAELEAAWYSRGRNESGADTRLDGTLGVNAQTRFHRTYEGRWGFSAFKHVLVPSITYTFRPDSGLDFPEAARFDALDRAFGRSRFETKIDNVLYGRDEDSGEVWQVGRLTLYQGNDIANEVENSGDYEIELDLRPRSWWGLQFVGERHTGGEEEGLQLLGRYVTDAYEELFDRPPPWERDFDFNREFGDFERILSQVYYDDTLNGGRFRGRVGFAYTKTRDQIFNREIHYGVGYRLGENWGLGIEHIYDIEEGDLRTQTYEVRRALHEWEAAFRVRSRESGVDVNLEFSLKDFPGSSFKL